MQNRNAAYKSSSNEFGKNDRTWGKSYNQNRQTHQQNEPSPGRNYENYLEQNRAQGGSYNQTREDADAAFRAQNNSQNSTHSQSRQYDDFLGEGRQTNVGYSDLGAGVRGFENSGSHGEQGGYAGGRDGKTYTEYLPNTKTPYRRARPAPREDAYYRVENDREPEDNYGSFSNNGNTWGSGSNYGSTYSSARERSESIISHQGKGPKGYRRPDSLIQEEVNEALTSDHHIDASEIEVAVKDGVVTLSGKVPERKMKRLAEDCAETVRGVKDVHNSISAAGFLSNLFG